MKALERPSFSGKFVLLGALTLALIAAPTTLYLLGALKSARQAERELHGVAPVRALLQFAARTQQHRGLAASILDDNISLRHARLAKQAELHRAFVASEQALQAAEVEPVLLTAWQQVGEQWRTLSEKIGQGTLTPRQSLHHHSQLIASTLQIEDALLDHFELALDPVPATHSLMRAALIELPQTAELIGQLRSYGALYLVQGRILPEQQGALMGLTTQALASLDRMSRAFAKAAAVDPAIALMLEEAMATLRPQIKQALALIDKELISAVKLDYSGEGDGASLQVMYPVKFYLAAYDRPIDSLHALGDSALAALEEKLVERRDGDRRHTLLMSAGLLVLLLVGGTVAILMVMRLLTQLNQAMAAAERYHQKRPELAARERRQR